jgi:hypothetical protein
MAAPAQGEADDQEEAAEMALELARGDKLLYQYDRDCQYEIGEVEELKEDE